MDIQKEKFRDAIGFEGFYQIGNYGTVLSLDRINNNGKFVKGRILKHTLDTNGYEVVFLSQYNKKTTKRIHRLIAEAFIPNPYNKPCIDHINGIKTDNREDNLRWCTNRENINYPISMENRKKASLKSKDSPYSRKVGKYTMENEYICSYDSISDASKDTGCSISKISAVCRGERKSSGGFIWKFESEARVQVQRPYKSQKGGYNKIIQYTLRMDYIAEYESIKEAAKKTGINETCIRRNVNGFRDSVYNYIFKYKDE